MRKHNRPRNNSGNATNVYTGKQITQTIWKYTRDGEVFIYGNEAERQTSWQEFGVLPKELTACIRLKRK